jgi:hypothetical protein
MAFHLFRILVCINLNNTYSDIFNETFEDLLAATLLRDTVKRDWILTAVKVG